MGSRGRDGVRMEGSCRWVASPAFNLCLVFPPSPIFMQEEVTEGCRLPVLRRNQDNEDEWRESVGGAPREGAWPRSLDLCISCKGR